MLGWILELLLTSQVVVGLAGENNKFWLNQNSSFVKTP
jgi:hypothetical protein